MIFITNNAQFCGIFRTVRVDVYRVIDWRIRLTGL